MFSPESREQAADPQGLSVRYHERQVFISRLCPGLFGPFLLSISVFIFSFFISLFCLVPCGRL